MSILDFPQGIAPARKILWSYVHDCTEFVFTFFSSRSKPLWFTSEFFMFYYYFQYFCRTHERERERERESFHGTYTLSNNSGELFTLCIVVPLITDASLSESIRLSVSDTPISSLLVPQQVCILVRFLIFFIFPAKRDLNKTDCNNPNRVGQIKQKYAPRFFIRFLCNFTLR
mgnify:CR=1 FL=1